MFLRELYEAKGSVGLIFGRFNPPHKGHRAAWEMASKNSTWYVGTNQSTQGPKDPLPYDVKIKAMETIWPAVAGHIVPHQSWLSLASDIYKKHGDVELRVYTDEDWVLQALNQYNGTEGKSHGFYNFSKITSVPTPRLSSATALRSAVADGNREAFADAAGVPADTPVDGTPFFDLVAKYLGQYKKEAVEPDEPGYQHNVLSMPANTLVIDTPGELDWYKIGQHFPTLGKEDPHEYGQSESDMVITFTSPEEMMNFIKVANKLGLKIKSIGGSQEHPEIHSENFADGKKPGRKGLSKRMGVNTKASVSSLRKTAKNSSGEKQRMAHWLANMKAGRQKAKKK